MKSKRGFGKILLSGFQKSGKKRKRSAPKAKKTQVRFSRISFRFATLGKRSKSKPPRSRKKTKAQKPTTPLVLNEVSNEPQSQSQPQLQLPLVSPPAIQATFVETPPQFQETSLSTQDILRPNDQLKQSIEGFLLDQRSEHTRTAYKKDLKRFVQFLLARKLDHGIENLNRSVLIAFKESLISEGLEHTTIDRHLATLRSFFKWLVDDGVLMKSPAEGVRFLNPKRISRTLGFSDEEVKKVLAQPDIHTRTGSLHYAILMILFYCGLRRSEVCNLRTSSVGKERDHRVLRLRGKGNAERVIVMIPPVWHALQHYLYITGRSLASDEFLFTPIRNNRTGVLEKPLDPSMVFYIVTKYSKEAGVANRVSPHSCRATAISNARDHNVPDRAIQEFAGWASPDMITRYDKRKTSVEKSAAHAIRYGSEDRSVPSMARNVQDGPEPPDQPNLLDTSTQ